MKGLNLRDRYAAEARDEHVTEVDNVLYIIIALVKVKTSKYLSKINEVWNEARGWKKKIHNSYVSFDSLHLRYMVRIKVIQLSVKYQNFFSFQNVTYAYPPHAVNVPFISSHIKVSRSSLEPNLSTWQFYFPCRLFFMFFFTWSWIQFFFKEIFLVIRNFCITIFEIELVFRRAERRCSGSLFSMLLFKKLYLMQIFNQYLKIKRMIHVQFWIRIYLLELNYLFEALYKHFFSFFFFNFEEWTRESKENTFCTFW